MYSAAKTFKSFLNQQLEVHGAIAELCRKTGISRNTVKSWANGATSPNLNDLDSIAKFFKKDPWDIIKPIPVLGKDPVSTTVEALTRVISDQEKQLKSIVKHSKIIEMIDQLDEKKLLALNVYLNSVIQQTSEKKTAKTS